MVEGAPWVSHLMSHMYTSIAYALHGNTKYLKEASNDFRKLVANIERHRFSRKDNAPKVVNFYLKQLAKSVHHCKNEYVINKTMRAEIEFFREALGGGSGDEWDTYIGLMIPRTPLAVQYGDSCLTAC